MSNSIMFNWQQLAQIKELKDYFETDYHGFSQRIEHHIHELQKIESKELDKLAILRVLEVTNGCTQWGFRRKDEQCLSVEQTRECMKKVIGFIQDKKIDLPSGESIHFTSSIKHLMDEARELYQDAFKKNIADKEKEYYAYSTALFLVCGRPRLNAASQLVKQEFESMFTTYYIEKGRNYIAPYIEAILP
ncbi:MAG: hypothetical protein EAZ09_13780 [Oscillatoriales cyanobacterium]|nr:MAG: hypothetical protein EAZ18_11865 [Oscillatoriales cyanobacterium]TAH20656.1 MAG: hypothetical protein EAZ09_13780 [Oscillatoriales cyanobacterium]